MASLGIVEMGAIVTRGWYRIDAGQCVRPDLRGDPHRLYSYAEAVDGNGRTVKRGDAPLAWGGNVALCTRDGRFELADHKDCAARGLNSAGFAAIDSAASLQPPCVSRNSNVRANKVPSCAARFRPRRNLGVRSRQHALPASSQSLAAGRRAHPRLCRPTF